MGLLKKSNKKQRFRTVVFWRKQKNKKQAEIEKIKNVIKAEQELCTHQYDDGRSAVNSEALFHPAQRPVCEICGKEF